VHRRILGVADVVEPATGNQLGRVGLPDSQDVTASAAQAATAQVPKQPADHGDPRWCWWMAEDAGFEPARVLTPNTISNFT
jgi:hypothetical protein